MTYPRRQQSPPIQAATHRFPHVARTREIQPGCPDLSDPDASARSLLQFAQFRYILDVLREQLLRSKRRDSARVTPWQPTTRIQRDTLTQGCEK